MSETGRLIAETGIRPSKSKGQNFLTDISDMQTYARETGSWK